MNSKGSASTTIVISVLFLVFVIGGIIYSIIPAKNQGYEPDQPLPFSHKTHAGKFNIPCMYCHISVEKSRHATVPPMNVCMNCHQAVKTDSPHIQKLAEAYKQGKPIPWVKVHDVPDFTYFNHKRHIAKGVKCQTCHGDVKDMEKIKQWAPLTMGWCVNCHRKPQYNAPTNCDTCHR